MLGLRLTLADNRLPIYLFIPFSRLNSQTELTAAAPPVVGGRGVTILALDPVPESYFNSFFGLLEIPIPDPDPEKVDSLQL